MSESDNQFKLNMRLDGKPLVEAIVRIGESIPKHDGDLGHNATVFYSDERYITDDGEVFFNREVCLSDKMRHFCLTPKEALSLLAWLKQEEQELQGLAKEQEG